MAVAVSVKAVSLKQMDEAAKAGFQEAKQNYTEATNEYKNAKRAYIEATAQLQSQGEEQKNQLRQQMQERSENFFSQIISAMIKYLEAMKNKAANGRISEDDRAGILAEIDGEISWLGAKQNEISQATSDQLPALRNAVRERWQNIRVVARKITGQILAAKISYIIEKAEAMAEKLEAKVVELKQAGKNVAELESLMADFEEKIALAKEKYEAAGAKFQAISGKDGADALLREGHKFVTEARQYLSQAHKDLVQMTKKIKQLEGPSTGSGNATSTQ